ncbi:hypothetical protein OpiT1DRAFT_05667 [Opitutaceae bacterium TAV1]|nr:hypothetical protein OpiT1DRAFT_05667 [Opitutaceae bacterium TAV1]
MPKFIHLRDNLVINADSISAIVFRESGPCLEICQSPNDERYLFQDKVRALRFLEELQLDTLRFLVAGKWQVR